MKNSINWFEIPVTNFERAKKFYTKILDSELQEEMMGNFRMGFLPCEQGGVGGALCYGEGYEPCDKGTVVYLNADGVLDEIISRIEPSGGKIVMPRMNVTPEIGDIAMFMDTEGNKIALHSPPAK